MLTPDPNNLSPQKALVNAYNPCLDVFCGASNPSSSKLSRIIKIKYQLQPDVSRGTNLPWSTYLGLLLKEIRRICAG